MYIPRRARSATLSARTQELCDPNSAMPKKGTAIPLAAFQSQMSRDGVGSVAEDRLPDGPGQGSASDAVGSRRWIAEWDGRSELIVESNVTPAAGGSEQVTTIDSFKAALDPCLREFLANGDLAEAARCVEELGAPQFHFQIIKRSVALAMDKTGRECEMVAVLLASLHARDLLTPAHVSKGFVALLESLDDLKLDIPVSARPPAGRHARTGASPPRAASRKGTH